MSIKITFRKELSVDLNEYYASFPPALRKAIDDALYSLLGGQVPKRRQRAPNLSGEVLMRCNGTAPKMGSKARVLYDELKREFPNGFPYAAAMEMALKLGEKAYMASDLKRSGYIKESKWSLWVIAFAPSVLFVIVIMIAEGAATMKALLLNMKDFVVVKEYENMAAAQAALDSEEVAAMAFPKTFVDRDEWDLTAVDMAKFYNNVPGVVAVKRFSDRKAAMARLLRALNGEIAPVTDETATKEVTRKKRTGNFAGKVTTIEEKAVKTKKTKGKKTATTTNGATAPRSSSVADSATLAVTKAGESRRWQKDSPRHKLFTYVQKKGEVTFAEFIKYGTSQLELARSAVLACFTKLTDSKHAAGGSSIKVSGRAG